MEKIQAAIAKARAAREARTDQVDPVPVSSEPAELTAESVEDTKPIPQSTPPNVEDAWRRIPTCTPRPGVMARNRVVTFDNTSRVPSIDILRTRVLQQMKAKGWKRLAVTSPGSGCGKSTMVLNLAFSLSRASEMRIVVGEMDMRRPSLASTLNLKGTRSFARVLDGKSDFAEEAVRPRPNLAVGLNEARVRNPAELLQGPTIGPALTKIEQEFDPTLMIFDLPPMMATDDAMAVMGQVDCALLVAAAGSTTLKEIDFCEADLAAQTNVLGVVLNKCRYMDDQSGYGYGEY